MFYIFSVLLLLLVILLFFMASQFLNLLFRGYAPYFNTHKKIIAKILPEFKLDEDSVVYELGAGEAPILRALEHKYPVGELIGLEYSFFPWFLGRLQIESSHSRIKLWKKNIFRVHLANATHIYCYLNCEMMERLEKKFHDECKKGTIVISYRFSMPHREPTRIIKSGRQEVYLYKL